MLVKCPNCMHSFTPEEAASEMPEVKSPDNPIIISLSEIREDLSPGLYYAVKDRMPESAKQVLHMYICKAFALTYSPYVLLGPQELPVIEKGILENIFIQAEMDKVYGEPTLLTNWSINHVSRLPHMGVALHGNRIRSNYAKRVPHAIALFALIKGFLEGHAVEALSHVRSLDLVREACFDYSPCTPTEVAQGLPERETVLFIKANPSTAEIWRYYERDFSKIYQELGPILYRDFKKA